MLTASEVAEYVIAYSTDHGDPLSESKLQCLLYYAQAWHLALFDRRLFTDQIEAWENGPVLPLVFENFERLSSGQDDDECEVLDTIVQDHLDCIMEKYGSMTDAHLQALTQHEAPWIVARAIAVGERFVIANQDMTLFYRYYPANDIFVRTVEVTYHTLVWLRIYQTSTAASAWIRKAWDSWIILCSYFGMMT